MSKKYSVGIDLGTSNSCVSICEVAGGSARGIDMTQILAPNVIGEKLLLASALYIPAPGEYAEDSLSLPWHGTHAPDYVVGAFARERAALVPDRMVTSAKSWLCNPHVNRREPILPWQSELEQGRSRRSRPRAATSSICARRSPFICSNTPVRRPSTTATSC